VKSIWKSKKFWGLIAIGAIQAGKVAGAIPHEWADMTCQAVMAWIIGQGLADSGIGRKV
jgi:hypothetical protein